MNKLPTFRQKKNKTLPTKLHFLRKHYGYNIIKEGKAPREDIILSQ